MAMMTLGEKVRALRLKHNLSQQAMATRLHMTRQGYGKIELNKSSPSVSRLVEIANIFNVSPGSLFPRQVRTHINDHDTIDTAQENSDDFMPVLSDEDALSA